MVKKKLDPRIRGLIEAGVKKNQRSLFVLVGDHGKDQVENIHKILAKSRVRSRPSVLWCYKKELGFSSHRQKRMKQIKKNKARGLHDPDRDDPFDLFISSTEIRWTYYKDSEKILGQTFGMCVLQDFEALTPNLLARTIETVEGGGIIILLLKTVKSLKQLYSMSMDVHSRFRTEAYHEVVPRFNERFILSLIDIDACLVLDDELNILPISSKVNELPVSTGGLGGGVDADEIDVVGAHIDPELEELKASLVDTPHVGVLVSLAKTVDQAQAVMSFLDAIAEKSRHSTVTLTAARGRGKSAALGMCLAGAVAYGYANIFITAPSPENLKTAFEFAVLGLKALKYNEHLDFQTSVENIEDFGKVVVRINIFRNHRQTIQYVLPSDHALLAQAELVAIDEAAAIPLPLVKRLMGPYLVFISSTINGYEGTGRALSLKLIQQLRTRQSLETAAAATAVGASVSGPSKGGKKGEKKLHEERWKAAADAAASPGLTSSRLLTELSLNIPIRYAHHDPIESWLNNLLCMDTVKNSSRIVSGLPAPSDCELYMVNRDALLSYHTMAEGLLQRIWSLYTSAHYKNSPNDLQMVSDAPAHRLFVLLGPNPVDNTAAGPGKGTGLPDVLCVVQVAFEGQISQLSVQSELSKGNKASGDMIPWNVSQQFNDTEFAGLSGARIVRIATHPDVQKMGYGSRAVDLILSYFGGQISAEVLPIGDFGGEGGDIIGESTISTENAESSLGSEVIRPKASLPSLLVSLHDRAAERLHWVGVSFGLTEQLLNFWSRKGFKVCYLRQTTNDLTGEHSCIMLRELNCEDITGAPEAGWLSAYVRDYRYRLISLMSYSFRCMPASLALTLLDPDRNLTSVSGSSSGIEVMRLSAVSTLSAAELLNVHLSQHDIKRLELYSRNMVDHHMILDTVPVLAKLTFQGRLPAIGAAEDANSYTDENSSGIHLSALQAVVLLGVGLQHREVGDLSKELNLPVNQILAFFNKTLRKITSTLKSMVEQDVEMEIKTDRAAIVRMDKRANSMTALTESLAEDQKGDMKEFSAERSKFLIKSKDLSKHAVMASDDALRGHLDSTLKYSSRMPVTLSVPISGDSDHDSTEKMTLKKRKVAEESGVEQNHSKKKKKKSKRSE